MSNYGSEIDLIRAWLRDEVENVSVKYWEANFRERGRAKRAGEEFTWRAGCHFVGTEYGARLQWSYIQPIGAGEEVYHRRLIEDNAFSVARSPKRMSDLQPTERATVMAVKSLAAPLEKLGKRIEEYDHIGGEIMELAQAMGWRP